MITHGLAQRRFLAQLSAAIQALPYDQRVAYVMCAIEQVPLAEAALTLGLRQGTLGRRVYDARQSLRKLLEGDSL